MSTAPAGDSLIHDDFAYDMSRGKTNFARWINDGEWMDLAEWGRSGSKNSRGARPFITNTQDEINANPSEILNALKKGI
jgi:hypothetical protein